jgi:DNA-binding NarL/FixJ family response regulator
MMIIGCDFHPRYQQIAMMDTETGELVERRLEHENGEARAFYSSLPKPARVGMEATGYAQWFERMLAEQIERALDTLSPREIEVLRLLAGGESNGQIAARLGLSINTVERHVVNIYRKIDARGRAEATAWAIRNGVA